MYYATYADVPRADIFVFDSLSEREEWVNDVDASFERLPLDCLTAEQRIKGMTLYKHLSNGLRFYVDETMYSVPQWEKDIVKVS